MILDKIGLTCLHDFRGPITFSTCVQTRMSWKLGMTSLNYRFSDLPYTHNSYACTHLHSQFIPAPSTRCGERKLNFPYSARRFLLTLFSTATPNRRLGETARWYSVAWSHRISLKTEDEK